jgi:hypothetical protein
MFGLFSFSFGNKLPAANYVNVSFWGGVLKNYDLFSNSRVAYNWSIREPGVKLPNVLSVEKEVSQENSASRDYPKPGVNLTLQNNKEVFAQGITSAYLLGRRKESVVMFYPQLPYDFRLYFQDRQIAHIELKYRVDVTEKKSSLVIKRKISSGNLEADLLCMRYIEQYLSSQQERAVPQIWQTVKIELEPKR